jgi:hypothetical protein
MMVDTPTTPDIASMSAAEATAALAQRKVSYDAGQLGPQPSAPSAVARLMLDRLSRDPDFQSRLAAGHQEANHQFAALCAAIANGNATDDAIAGGPEPSGDHIETTEGGQLSQSALRREVGALRGMGFGDDVIKQMVDGTPVSATEKMMATQLLALRKSNSEFVQKYLAGDAAARIEMSLLATISRQMSRRNRGLRGKLIGVGGRAKRAASGGGEQRHALRRGLRIEMRFLSWGGPS